ncbi:MAG: TonB family protein [Gemmatimonadota bacterium]
MSAQAVPGTAGLGRDLTANERFKRSFGSWFWSSMILATVAHFSVFAFWPEMTAEDVSYSSDELTAIELPPEIEIPPPPEAIARPATPVMATADIDEDITIAPTTFEDNPVEDLPPPPEEVTTTDISAAPTFTPFTVKPDIRNRAEVARALEREYPPLLRDAGIGGTVDVWFFIDEQGAVVRTQVDKSSGHKALDDAAVAVADIIQFTPALNRDKRVPVWISLPITFTTR